MCHRPRWGPFLVAHVRALKQPDAERQAAAGARKEAQAAAVEGAALKGELASLRGTKK